MGGDGAYQLDYTWQPFSIFAKNEKFVLFRFFAKNSGAKKRKFNGLHTMRHITSKTFDFQYYSFENSEYY